MMVKDQLSEVRKLFQKKKKVVDNPYRGKVIAFFGPKGGSGKSVLSLNFSISFLKKGAKVLLIDMDFSCPNIHTLIGILPTAGIKEYLDGRVDYENIVKPYLPLLDVIIGGKSSEMIELRAGEVKKLYNLLEILKDNYDFIFLDMPSTIESELVEVFYKVDLPLLVSTPEPASIKGSLQFLKFLDGKLHSSKKVFHILNKLHHGEDPLFIESNFYEEVDKFLNLELEYLCSFQYWTEIVKSVLEQKPHLLYAPFDAFSDNVRKTAEILMKRLGFKGRNINAKLILNNYISHNIRQ